MHWLFTWLGLQKLHNGRCTYLIFNPCWLQRKKEETIEEHWNGSNNNNRLIHVNFFYRMLARFVRMWRRKKEGKASGEKEKTIYHDIRSIKYGLKWNWSKNECDNCLHWENYICFLAVWFYHWTSNSNRSFPPQVRSHFGR